MTQDRFAGDPRSHWQRMLDGDPYLAVGPEFDEHSDRAARLADEYRRATLAGDPGAREVLASLVGQLGEDVELRPPLFVDYGFRLSIGPRTFVNFGLTALDVAPISIGADCQIGPHVQLLTPTHPLEPEARREKLESAEPIVVQDNVWLGGGVVVCPGVTIGENSVVGAGSVVARDIPANVVAVGSPARVVRRLD